MQYITLQYCTVKLNKKKTFIKMKTLLINHVYAYGGHIEIDIDIFVHIDIVLKQ